MRLVDVENLDVVSWQSIPEGYSDTFEDGVRWILEKIDKLPPEPQSKLTNDQIWEKLSEVYNMPDVPDTAKEIIGNVMLVLDDFISIQAVLDLPRHKETFLSGGTYAEYIDVEDIEMLPSIKTPPKGH